MATNALGVPDGNGAQIDDPGDWIEIQLDDTIPAGQEYYVVYKRRNATINPARLYFDESLDGSGWSEHSLSGSAVTETADIDFYVSPYQLLLRLILTILDSDILEMQHMVITGWMQSYLMPMNAFQPPAFYPIRLLFVLVVILFLMVTLLEVRALIFMNGQDQDQVHYRRLMYRPLLFPMHLPDHMI